MNSLQFYLTVADDVIKFDSSLFQMDLILKKIIGSGDGHVYS